MKRMLFLVFFSFVSFVSFGNEKSLTTHFIYYINDHIGFDMVYGNNLIRSNDDDIKILFDLGFGFKGFNKKDFSMDFWSDITILIEKYKWLWYYFTVGGKYRLHYPWEGSYGLIFGFGVEIPISKYLINGGLVMNILSKDPPQDASGIVIGIGYKF